MLCGPQFVLAARGQAKVEKDGGVVAPTNFQIDSQVALHTLEDYATPQFAVHSPTPSRLPRLAPLRMACAALT